MLYRLVSKSRAGVVCEIETEADIEPIIKGYGTKHTARSIGYHNQEGEKRNFKEYYHYEDLVYYDEKKYYYVEEFEAYKDSSQISPSDTDSFVANKSFQGDIRRVFADILYVLYILKPSKFDKEGIKRVKLGKTEYINIKNVRLDEHKRIQFEAETTTDFEEVCLLPIPLSPIASYLSKYSSDIYVLESREKKIKLDWAFSFPMNQEASRYVLEKTESSWPQYQNKNITMDFFWGTNEEKRGIFYWYGDKLIPFYAVTSKGELLYTNFFETIEEQHVKTVSEEEKAYFESKDIRSKTFKEAVEWYSLIESLGVYPAKLEVSLHGTNYVGTRYLTKYKFSDIQAENLMIDCDVKVEKENDEYIVAEVEKVQIILGHQESICLMKDGLIYKRDEEEQDFSWSVLKVNHVISPDFCMYDSGQTIEAFLSGLKKRCIELANEVTIYLKDEKKMEILKELAKTEAEKEIAEVEKFLYPAPFVADRGVAKIVYEEKKKYDRSQKMPNFAIMGGPGLGKSTLVKRVAAYMKGSAEVEGHVIHSSTSDLKGAYVGQTANRVFELLKEADDKMQIVFIDEAYNLQADQFGKEALEMLLPLISGDRKDIKCVGTDDKGNKKEFKSEFKHGVPGIWLAGYEQELRKMLVENPGLYRRMVKISLADPTVTGLYDKLLGMATKDNSLHEAFARCEKEIKNYFSWASSKEYVAYFGNYAGVEDFYRTCEVRVSASISVKTDHSIREIIEEKKREIKKQYKAVLAETDLPKFEVQREVSVVLNDVKGNANAVSGMEQIAKMLLERERYEREGIYVPKGALLVGPPGTGKTMLARALAGEIQTRYEESDKKDKSVAFISVAATELNTPKKISALFEEAAEYDSSIIFIDEVDAIGKHRDVSPHPEVLIQLMKEMDGFEERKNIFVMAATNAPEALDPALKRPGRFDRNIEVSYPDEEGREAILLSYLKKLSAVAEEINKEDDERSLEDLAKELAQKTRAFVPAELKNLVNEAAILHKETEEGQKNAESKLAKHRENLTSQSTYERFRADILEALERYNIGEPVAGRKEKAFQDEENTGSSSVAVHEVGHALVSILLGIDPFEKITVISRGDALGYVSPSQKNTIRTKKDILNKIKVCLGGRIAEEIFYGDDISMGAVQDIQQATALAENMVTLYGMSEEIGPMALKSYQQNYLGGGQSYRCSDAFRSKAEAEINAILKNQLAEARGMLKEQKDMIRTLAKFVFEKETLTGEEFKQEYERIRTEV